MTLEQAHKATAEASQGRRNVFVAEWADNPGRFSPIAEKEYLYDARHGHKNGGRLWNNAVAEYYDGHVVE